mgnify:CR=1 FL=1
MARQHNGEGSWGTKTIKGVTYIYFRNTEGKYFYGKTNSEINTKRRKWEETQKQLLTSAVEDIRRQAFGDYVLSWLLDQKKLEIKRNSTDGYEACLNGQLLNYTFNNLSDKQVGILTTDDFIQYYSSLAKHYSRSTIKKNYAILSQCINYGNKHNHFSQFIDLDDIKIPHEDVVAKKKKKIQFLTEEDVNKFCLEAKRINTPGFNFGGKIGESTYGNNAYLLMFILFTGIRISEGIELQWKDINSEKKYFTVSKNAATVKDRSDDNKYVHSVSSTKTQSGYRSIPLNEQALLIIEHEEKLNPDHTPDDYVFITKNGGKIKSRQNVNRTLKKIMLRANCSVSECTVHALRHTFGSLLIKKGVDIKVVSEILGHKDVSVTYNIYIHIIDEQKVSAMAKLNEIFSSSDNNMAQSINKTN